MLILSRGFQESVLVGDDVQVMPADIRCGDARLFDARVRIGFRAPDDVTILRREVALRAASAGGGTGGPHQPPRKQLPGYSAEVSDAVVRLRIEYPAGLTVHHHKRSRIHVGGGNSIASFPAPQGGHATGAPPSRLRMLEIDCGKDDSILVGNVTIVIVDVRRFVRTGRIAAAPPS